MNSRTINFQEEFSSKIPALTLLTNMGYQFIHPSECEILRGNNFAADDKSTQKVILAPIMRAFLAKHTFPFAGEDHKLSDAAIDKVMHELNPAMNLGLRVAKVGCIDMFPHTPHLEVMALLVRG